MKALLLLSIALLSGCMISSRRIAGNNDEPQRLQSGYYAVYTNDTERIFRKCSYTGGPFKDSTIYPATRRTLNVLSLYSYSSAASGAYMLIPPTLVFYPFVMCNLPIQFCLDTVLVPWDLYNVPEVPEGFERWKE
jgi:uncharacterized protein YceK